MKRFRVRAVGLGFALAAGSALAAEGDWQASGQAPAPLPPAVRADSGPIWLPVQKAEPQQPVIRTGGAISDPDFTPLIPVAPPQPQVQPQPQPQPQPSLPKPTQWPPEPPSAFGPRAGGGWLAVLRFPETKESWKGTFELVLWALPKDDDALLKDLATK